MCEGLVVTYCTDYVEDVCVLIRAVSVLMHTNFMENAFISSNHVSFLVSGSFVATVKTACFHKIGQIQNVKQ